MKRYLFIVLTLIMSWNVLSAANKVQIGDLYYYLDSSTRTASVTSPASGKYSGDITIPSTITDGDVTYDVTSIGSYAFQGCKGLTSVTIGNNVTSIGNSAFKGCTGLTSVTIGNNVASIADYAFYGCTGLTSVVWNAKNCYGWSGYSNAPFYDLRDNITSFTFGDEVMSIPHSLCYGMDKLTSITIPNSVKSIYHSAFYGCTSLTSVVWNAKRCSYSVSPFDDAKDNITSFSFGDEVTSIPHSLCYDMDKLTSITIPNNVTSIGDSAFYSCDNLTSITIPNSVTSIGSYAFSGCNITSITIPNSVTSIGSYAFSGCNITSATIGNSVTGIGDGVFAGCTGLTSITIPNNVTSIGSYAFAWCEGLTSVAIPNSVTSIGSYAFYNCTGLTSVTIGNNVTNIGDYAFKMCTSLTFVTIGNSVTSIGNEVFYGCTSLTSIVWNAKDCYGWSGYYNAPFYDLRDNITSFTFGDEVESIPGGLCYGMDKLTSITIPNSVKYIAYSVFKGCSSLTSVIIGNSVISIKYNAFEDCSGLTSIVWNAKACGNAWIYSVISLFYDAKDNITSFTFGNEVDSIPYGLCCGLSKLTSITIPNSVTKIGNTAFSGCTSLTSIVVDSGNTIYDSRENCNAIIETATNTLICGCQNTTIPNSVTSVGDRAFEDCTSLTSITIPESVTSIGSYAFFNCTGLTSITIPNSVTSIGDYAFEYCRGLTSVTIGNSVTSIGERAFSDCGGLVSITIPNSVTSIGGWAFSNTAWDDAQPDGIIYINNVLYRYKGTMPQETSIAVNDRTVSISGYAFYHCTGLTSITIPNGVTSIGNEAFAWCKGLTSITIPNSVTSIGEEAFEYCNSLTSVVWNAKKCGGWSGASDAPFYDINYKILSFTFGDEVDSIPSYLCYGMNKLTSITIPNSVTSIGSYGFCKCTGLTSIIIPNSITSIGDGAFCSCKGITSITIPNSVTSIGDYAFDGCSGWTSLSVLAVVPPKIEASTFGNDSTSIPIYIPCGTKEAYQSAEYWSNFTNYTEDWHYTLKVATNNENMGSAQITKEATSCSDNEGIIEAIANEHCHFVQWNDGSTDNPRNVSVNGYLTYTAEFAIDQYTISVSAENGSINGAGTYDYGTNAILTAVADEHYHFVQWSDGNTDNPRTVSVNGDATYRAEFAIDQHTISVSAENGSVNGAGTYDYGTNATLTAVADGHYHFVQWSDGNTDNPRTVSVDGDATYTAEFAIDQHTISLNADKGTVFGAGTYDYGTLVTLTATPNKHYHFEQWSDGNTDNPRTISVEGDITLTAEFAIDRFTITATCDEMQGEATGSGVYDYGEHITLTATPNSGYEFKQWSNGITYNPYRFTVVSDLTLEAEFIPTTAVDNISASDDNKPQKVLYQGQLFIVSGGCVYTATGVKVNLAPQVISSLTTKP